MAKSEDHLFDRLLDLVEDMVDGKPKPPPIPAQPARKKKKKLPFHRRLDDVNQAFLQAQEQDAPEELIVIIDQLSAFCRTMEKDDTLRCFSAGQLEKLSIGYNEMVKNTLVHVDGVLTPAADDVARARHDMQFALLRQVSPHLKTMYRELNTIRRTVKKGDHPSMADFIDALGRALEVVGYDESIMAVEKKQGPPPVPDRDVLPQHCRIAFRLADASASRKPGERLELSLQIRSRKKRKRT